MPNQNVNWVATNTFFTVFLAKHVVLFLVLYKNLLNLDPLNRLAYFKIRPIFSAATLRSEIQFIF
jgi:hypothetical protein